MRERSFRNIRKSVLTFCLAFLVFFHSMPVQMLAAEGTKQDQEALIFDQTGPIDACVGEVLSNAATGGTAEVVGDIVYTSADSSQASVDAATGEVTILAVGSGSVDIIATKAGDENYNDVSATYTINITKGTVPDSSVSFGKDAGTYYYIIPEVQLSAYTFAYDQMSISDAALNEAVVASVAPFEGFTDNGNGTFSLAQACDYTQTATWGNDNWNKVSKAQNYSVTTYSMAFEKEVTENIGYSDGATFENQALVTKVGSYVGDLSVQYAGNNDEVATVDADSGVVTIHKAGSVTVTASIVQPSGDDVECLNCGPYSVSYTLNIGESSRSLSFADANPTPINTSTSYTNIATPSVGEGAVTYSSSDSSVVSVDSSTGALTIHKAGSVTISAHIEADGQYGAADASYNLVINRTDRLFYFAASDILKKYGEDFTAPVLENLSGTGSVVYSVSSDSNGVVQSINETTGEIHFNDGVVGTVIIQASVGEDDIFSAASASYTLTIEQMEIVDVTTVATLEGTRSDGQDWYTGNIHVKALDGYELSTSNALNDNSWNTTITDAIVADGENLEVKFYAREIATGVISQELSFSGIRKDGTGASIQIKVADTLFDKVQSVLDKILSFFKIDVSKNEMIELTITAEDAFSSVASIQYYTRRLNSGDSLWAEADIEANVASLWESYTDPITYDNSGMTALYVKAVDGAGNVAYASTNKVIVDDTLPTLDITVASSDEAEIKLNLVPADDKAGLKKVSYKIICNEGTTAEVVTQEETNLYEFTESNPDDDALVLALQNPLTIVVSRTTNNYDDVKVYVTVEDNAGNIVSKEHTLSIDASAPQITVEMLPGDANRIVDNGSGTRGYFRNARTATITIQERSSNFSEADAIAGIVISRVDSQGNATIISEQEKATMLGQWIHTSGAISDEDTHSISVAFSQDANYIWSVSYTDKAGNVNGEIMTTGDTPWDFTVDTEAPSGKVWIQSHWWDALQSTLTFQLWQKEVTAEIKLEIKEGTSPVESALYYISEDTEPKDRNVLDGLGDDEWSIYTIGTPITVNAEKKFVVYVKLVDYAGNYVYLSSDGYVIDTKHSTIEWEMAEANESGFYNTDVEIAVTVKDAAPYSGIKSIYCWAVCNGTESELARYDFVTQAPAGKDLVGEKSLNLHLDAEIYSSNDITVWVKTVDNAGNEYSESRQIKIDSKAPVVLVNMTGNPNRIEGEKGYYQEARTAIITIVERTDNFTFDKSGIQIEIKDAKGDSVTMDVNAMISDWTTIRGNTPDEDKHVAEIIFEQEANYMWSVSCTDKAGNVSATATTVGATPWCFAVDDTAPSQLAINIKEKKWSSLLNTITFGLFGRENLDITMEAEDITSPYVIEYLKLDGKMALSENELDMATGWVTGNQLSISGNDILTLFMRATDYAGNRAYVCTNGYVVDTEGCIVEIKAAEANENGCYNEDVPLEITVLDAFPHSGIKKVDYQVVCAGIVTASKNMYTADASEYTYGELQKVSEMNFEETVKAADNNSSDVKIIVTVEDNAGNITNESILLDIDITAPTIALDFEEDSPHKKAEDGRGYYAQKRVATLKIVERTNHFDRAEMFKGIQDVMSVKGADGKDIEVDFDTMFSWKDAVVDIDNPDLTVHEATIVFDTDANYDWSISYKDKAGNSSEMPIVEAEENPWKFTVDTGAPMGSIVVGNWGPWDEFLDTITLGWWSKVAFDVKVETKDAISPIDEIWYLKTDASVLLKLDEVEALEESEWTRYKPFHVEKEDAFMVYAKVMDYAGNISYVHSDGVMLDFVAPGVSLSAPSGVSNGSVRIGVNVSDPVSGGVHSGLESVSYTVSSGGSVTQSGNLYIQNGTNDYNCEGSIDVEASKNNSNDVGISVRAVDKAGNVTESSVTVKIDTTKPKIQVSYDNNSGDATFGDKAYFNAKRVATIVISERNFVPENVSIKVTNSEGATPVLSGWTSADGQSDSTTHTATLVFAEDGDYTFDMSCVDAAGNVSEGVEYGTSMAPTSFVIDQKQPVVSVVYDNDKAINGNYYNDTRLATITIDERNFETSRLNVTVTAMDDGVSVVPPQLSGWSNSGDIHKATVFFEKDALYTLNVSYIDMAGNSSGELAMQEFYVDKTAPTLEVEGIVDKSANNSTGDIGFKVIAEDKNFNLFKVHVLGVLSQNGGFVSKELEVGNYTNSANESTYIVGNLEDDGVYVLKCELADMAGNTYNQVVLHDNSGTEYISELTETDQLLNFSINRNGSAYSVDDNTAKLIGQEGIHYVQNVAEDIVFYEINADSVAEATVTLNGQDLTEGTDYTRVLEERAEGDWYKYVYTIDKALFCDNEGLPIDGEYTVVISSTDRATNTAYSDIKGCKVYFVIDTVAPVVTIMSGMVEQGRYEATQQQVVFRPVDDGGYLSKVIVRIFDNESNLVDEPLKLSGQALDEALLQDNGELSFVIPEGYNQVVQILCYDSSEDEDGNVNEAIYQYNDITVSSSKLMIVWSNKTVKWAVAGGGSTVAAAGAGAMLLAIRKRRLRKR